MTRPELEDTVAELRATHDKTLERLQRIDDHLNDNLVGGHAGVHVPRRATHEFQLIVDQARFNVLPLVVTAVAQNLFVDGYRPTGESGRPKAENAPIWDAVWQPNRMDARQAALYRGALAYGIAYAIVLPPREPTEPVKIIPRSPLRMTAVFNDARNDEWPQVALELERTRRIDATRSVRTLRVFDADAIYELEMFDDSTPPEYHRRRAWSRRHTRGAVLRFLRSG